MDQSRRAQRLLQCAWLSSDRNRLVLPLDTVAGVLVTQTVSKPTALKFISKLHDQVPRLSIFSFFLAIAGYRLKYYILGGAAHIL